MDEAYVSIGRLEEGFLDGGRGSWIRGIASSFVDVLLFLLDCVC